MFGARADNRTAFCAAKTWFAVAAATARSRCGLRSREYTKFSVKRPRRSENSGTHRTHPRRLHLSDIRKDICLCLGRERIIEPLFAQQKLGSPKRRKKKLYPTVKSRASNELREPHQRSQFGEAQRTHLRTYRFNQFHLFDGLFMFGARADNRTAFSSQSQIDLPPSTSRRE